MQTFLTEFFGTTSFEILIAWYLIALIGAITGVLVRRNYGGLKTYPFNLEQMGLGFLIVFTSIRLSSFFGYEPTIVGAYIIGLTHNEIALKILKKYLDKKE